MRYATKKTALFPLIILLILLQVTIALANEESDSDWKKGLNWQLTSYEMLTRNFEIISKHYYDPYRLDPETVLEKGINEIAQSIPDVVLSHERGSNTINMAVEDKHYSIECNKLNSLGSAGECLKEIIDYVVPFAYDNVNLERIEHNIIQATYGLLDPHSSFFSQGHLVSYGYSGLGNYVNPGFFFEKTKKSITITGVVEDSLSSRAGLEKGDKILKIDGTPVYYMDIKKILEKLSGKRGDQLSLQVIRKGWKNARMIKLSYDIISSKTVRYKRLKNQIGYIHVSGFKQKTTSDVKEAIIKMKLSGFLNGLILDLRGNPGGLVSEAISMIDLFISEGEIFSMQAYNGDRMGIVNSHHMLVEDGYPLAILIDSNSASASEMVAGALKHHNRAVIIGETSFGKGSMQNILSEYSGEVYRLTIAQYLLPGESSIQATGVVPDISLPEVMIEKNNFHYKKRESSIFEKDIKGHLENSRILNENSEYVIPYNFVEKRDKFESDSSKKLNTSCFVTEFARNVLKLARKHKDRKQILQIASDYVTKTQKKEAEQISKQMKKHNVIWENINETFKGKLDFTVSTPKNMPLKPGKSTITVKASNNTPNTFAMIRVVSISDNPSLDGLEFLFGNIESGKSKTWTADVDIPKFIASRTDDILLVVYSEDTQVDLSCNHKLHIEKDSLPRFSYNYNVVETKGNKDGLMQPGETITLKLQIQNKSKTTVKNGAAFLMLQNTTNKLYIHNGKYLFENMSPNKITKANLTFEIDKEYDQDFINFNLGIIDKDSGANITESFKVKLHKDKKPQNAGSKTVSLLGQGSFIYPLPDDKSGAFIKVLNDTPIQVLRSLDNWVNISLNKNQSGWVKITDMKKQKINSREKNLTNNYFREPPQITINDETKLLYTDQESINISGFATNDRRVKNVFITVNGIKVFNQSAPMEQNVNKLDFNANIMLKEGSNTIQIKANEKIGFEGVKTIYIYRKKSKDTIDNKASKSTQKYLDQNSFISIL